MWRKRVRVASECNTEFGNFISKKEPKLSARDMTEEIEGNGDGSLRCSRLLTVCQRCLGLTEEEETNLE